MATEAGKVQDALDEYKEANDGVITAIKDGTSIDSFKDVENALAGKQATGDYATTTEAQGYADAKDEAIAAAQKAGDDAQADVDALAEKVGTVADGKTVVQMIEDAREAATYDDTQVKADIKTNADAITKLNADSETEGSVDYKIAQAVAAIMENPDETMNVNTNGNANNNNARNSNGLAPDFVSQKWLRSIIVNPKQGEVRPLRKEKYFL